jgi:hypothetical protein
VNGSFIAVSADAAAISTPVQPARSPHSGTRERQIAAQEPTRQSTHRNPTPLRAQQQHAGHVLVDLDLEPTALDVHLKVFPPMFVLTFAAQAALRTIDLSPLQPAANPAGASARTTPAA